MKEGREGGKVEGEEGKVGEKRKKRDALKLQEFLKPLPSPSNVLSIMGNAKEAQETSLCPQRLSS